MRLPVAVILGGSANAVSVARSLHRVRVNVIAVGGAQSAVRYSRATNRFVPMRRTDDIQTAWLDWFERDGPRGAVILPCDDDGLELIATQRARLTALDYTPIEANDDILLAMLDKQSTYRLAGAAGIETPKSFAPATPDQLDAAIADMLLPCAVKPIHAHLFQRRARRAVKAIIVATEDELRAAYAYVSGLGVGVQLTEIIPGGDDQLCSYYSYLDEEGTPLLQLTKHKIRQHPHGFGLGCYHITDWNPEVAALGLRFFQGVGVRGLANVEFKRDARDGRLKLIECNHRFTAANEQLRVAGMDLALFTYARLAGLQSPRVGPYRTGVRFWYPVEDTRAYLQHRRDGTLSLTAWLRSVMHRQTFPLFSPSDPLPSLVSNLWLARRVVARLRETGRAGRCAGARGDPKANGAGRERSARLVQGRTALVTDRDESCERLPDHVQDQLWCHATGLLGRFPSARGR